MTVVRPRHRPRRSHLLTLAPLLAAAWLPWWSTLGYVLVLWLSRQDSPLEVVRVPLLVLVALGSAFAEFAGQLELSLWRIVQIAVPFGLSVALLSRGVGELESKRPHGLLWLLPLLLLGTVHFARHPGLDVAGGLGLGVLSLGLLGLGKAGHEERPARRLVGSSRVGVQVVSAGALAAGLLGWGVLLLGSGQTTGGRLWQRGPAAWPGLDVLLLGDLMLLFAAGAALWWGLWRPSWRVSEVLGLGATAAMGASLVWRSRRLLAVAPVPVLSEGGGVPLATPTVVATWAWWGLLAGLFALGWYWWRIRQKQRQADEALLGDDFSLDEDWQLDDPTHRVRRAYRLAQKALRYMGLQRQQAETPTEHLRRVQTQLPEAQALALLVRLYLPVRYGAELSDAQAEAAEAAAAQIVGRYRQERRQRLDALAVAFRRSNPETTRRVSTPGEKQ